MRVVRWLAWIAGGILVLLAVGFLVLRSLLPVERLRAEALSRAEAATGYDFELGELSLGLSLRGFELRGDGISVSNPQLAARGEEGARFLELQRLEIGVALLPLLRRRVEVTRLELVRPVMALERDASGRTNMQLEAAGGGGGGGPGAPGGGAGAGSAGVLLAVPEAKLRDARLRLVDETAGLSLGFDDLDGTLRVAVGADTMQLAGTLQVARQSAAIGAASYGPYDLGLDFDLAYEPAAARLVVRSATLSLAAIRLAVSGAVSGLDGAPELDLALATGRFEPARVLSLLPAGLPAGLGLAGTAELSARLRGPAAAPAVDGSLALRALAVTPPGQAQAILSAVDGSIEFSRSSATIRSLEGRIPGGRFELQAAVHDLTRPRLEGRLELEAELEALAALLPPAPGLAVHGGRLAATVHATGAAPDFRATLEVGGGVQLEGVEAQLPGVGPPLQVVRCPITLQGRSAAIDGLALRAGRSDLEGSVRLASFAEPALTFALRAQRLDLDELLPAMALEEAGAAPGDAAGAGAGGGGRGEPSAGRGGPPPLVPIDGTVAAGEVIYHGLAATRVRLRAVAGRRGLRIEDLSGHLLGGTLAGDVTLEPVTADSLVYRSTLAVTGVEANELLTATTPIHDLIYGTLDADLDLSGAQSPGADPLALLSARGNTRVKAGHLQARGALGTILRQLGVVENDTLPFDELVSKLVVQDGRVQLDNGKMISGKRGTYHISGSVGFDRSLAIRLDGLVPGRFLPGEVTRNPQLVRLLADDQGRVPLGFTIGGTLDRPRVQLELGDLQRRFEARLEEQAAEKLKGQAGKALDGLLQGVFGGKKDDR